MSALILTLKLRDPLSGHTVSHNIPFDTLTRISNCKLGGVLQAELRSLHHVFLTSQPPASPSPAAPHTDPGPSVACNQTSGPDHPIEPAKPSLSGNLEYAPALHSSPADPKTIPLAFERLRHPKGWQPAPKPSISQFLEL